jgi:hypothetical protein
MGIHDNGGLWLTPLAAGAQVASRASRLQNVRRLKRFFEFLNDHVFAAGS